MPAKGDTADNVIPVREVELMGALPLRGHSSLGLESASTLVHDVYGDPVDFAIPIVGGISVFDIVEDDTIWTWAIFRWWGMKT